VIATVTVITEEQLVLRQGCWGDSRETEREGEEKRENYVN